MPNHWESSARPLFVKTVYVNGSRHAVLFEKDPLLHGGNSPFKKTSRPSSSISFSSDLSISTSKSEEYKSVNLRQSQNKDLSTELQSCLVKLKLASANKGTSREDKCFCAKEGERIQGRGSSKQKRQKWNREKRKQCEREESRACKLSGRKNSCYIYNLENYNGKKNYCFVKISSQPPELILNCCCCCCGSGQYHTCDHANKNMVISATIHNLVMTPNGHGNVFPFENAELYWNNYVTTSYYNSLSERVLQWLDLARKRKKQNEKLNGTAEDDSMNGIERIFSGKAFADEIKKTECSFKSGNRIAVNADEFRRSNTFESDVKGEVIAEPNVETLISKDLAENISSNKTFHNKVEDFESKREHNSENSSTKTDFSYPLTVSSKDWAPKLSNIPRSNKSPLKLQDLLLNCHSKENYGKRKTKEAPSQFKEKKNGEGEDLLITTLNNWTGEVGKKNVFVGKFDKQQRCHCNRKLHENADKIKNQILTESLPERNQKSINNPNNTRGRPVLIQNLLSPQQPDKMSYLQEEKIVWASEKNTGRPQLHIFMPSISLKDQSDDSMSECDNYLNL